MQVFAKVRAQNEAWEFHFMLLKVQENVGEMNPRTPKWAPTLRIRVLMDF
jgi:hypothetical protein